MRATLLTMLNSRKRKLAFLIRIRYVVDKRDSLVGGFAPHSF